MVNQIGIDSKMVNDNGISVFARLQEHDSTLSAHGADVSKMKQIWIDVTRPPYNAKGDGVADDTAAFNSAIADIKVLGGGILYIPCTLNFYKVDGEVTLVNNLIIASNFATIKKLSSSTTNNLFVSRSYANTGYGSGANNVIIEGLIFKGDFSATQPLCNSWHHARNISVRNCIFNETQSNTHSFDLAGCRDITIDNVTWYGSQLTSGREYVECVQIDHSSYLSQPSVSNTDTYDGLATMNVTVQNCKFLPLLKNGTTYPAPNPMGNHSRWKDIFYYNIRFLNNYIEGGSDTALWASTHTKGWLHFYHCHDVIIEGNTFVNTNSATASVITFLTYTDAHTISQITMTGTVPTVTYDPQCAKNVVIRNNKFKNFNSVSNDVGLIKIEGMVSTLDSLPRYSENVIIEDNSFIDCYDPTQITAQGTQGLGDDNIYLTYAKDVRVRNNYFNQSRRAVYVLNSLGVDIYGNHGDNVYWHVFNLATSTDVNIKDNTFRHISGFAYCNTITGLNIEKNKISDDSGTSFSSNLIAVRTCTRFKVKSNELIGNSGSTYTGINVYSTSADGVLRDNFIVNFASTTISSDSNASVKNQDRLGLTWVSVGDSITYGNGVSGAGKYQDTALPLVPNVKTHYNRGYSGYSMTKYSVGSTGSSIQDVTSAFEVADVYTVFLGTNDFSRNAPIGSSADASGKLDSFWGGMKKVYADLYAKNPNAIIIFITPLKRIVVSGGSTIAWDTANTATFKLTDYCTAIVSFANMNACPVIDLFNISGINTTSAPNFLGDGLHPNSIGNPRIGRLIAYAMNQYV